MHISLKASLYDGYTDEGENPTVTLTNKGNLFLSRLNFCDLREIKWHTKEVK